MESDDGVLPEKKFAGIVIKISSFTSDGSLELTSCMEGLGVKVEEKLL